MIQIEITNICNIDCVYCNRKTDSSFFSSGSKSMTPKEFDHILDSLLNYSKDLTKQRLAICGLGEPFMNPQFLNILQNDKISNFDNFDFSTNGTVMSKSIIEQLTNIDYKLHIRFSLQSINQTQMEKMQVGASFKNVITNIRNFELTRRKKEKDNIIVKIQNLQTPMTENETMEDFEKIIGLSFNDNFVYNKKRGVQITSNNESISDWPSARLKCSRYGQNIIFNVYGDLTACCWDCSRDQIYGNIFEDTLDNIRNNVLIKQRRNELKNNQFNHLPICERCLKHD